MQKKKVRNYGKNKKAFDFIFSHYRKLSCVSPMRDSVHNVGSARGGGGNFTGLPGSDFKCTVELIVKLVVPKEKRAMFYEAYLIPSPEAEPLPEGHTPYMLQSADYIQQEQHVDQVLGGARHSYEQRLGELFIRKELYKEKK